MKKIKAIAVLTAMTLTFSMFATAASAADIDFMKDAGTNISSDKLTGYSRADFKANLANAKYAALFNFDTAANKTTANNVDSYALNNAITNASEKSDVTITGTSGKFTVNNNIVASTSISEVFASGNGALVVYKSGSITINLNSTGNLKPVAIGYAVNIQNNKTSGGVNPKIDVYLSGKSDAAWSKQYDYTSGSKLLRFFGYKAPVGESIEKIVITNTNTVNALRIDDLCIIYEETSNIEKGMRFSTDRDGYVEINSISQLDDVLHLNVASKYADTNNMVFYAAYDENNKIIKLSFANSGLTYTAKTISDIKDQIKTVKAFVWDKSTLTPQALNATIE